MKLSTLRKFILVILPCILLTACMGREDNPSSMSVTPSTGNATDTATDSAIDEDTIPVQDFLKDKNMSITVNQVGYPADSNKVAIFRNASPESNFMIMDATTGAKVFTGKLYRKENVQNLLYGDFSSFTQPGQYYITYGESEASYIFHIKETDVYQNLHHDLVKMLYYQRCGTDITDDIFGHKKCHTAQATLYGTKKTLDVSGGWHDAGDFGRYIVPAAQTVAQLLYSYETSPQSYGDNTGIPESANGIPDILDEVRYELEWMLKMQERSGGVYHKVTCAYHPAIIMPEEEQDALFITPVSTTATADFCGAMALAYEIYADVDESFAASCLQAAKEAWNYLEKHPKFIFDNPEDITTGDYSDTKDTDERYWAAAQMYRATGEQAYLDTLTTISSETGLGWQGMGDYGNIAILTNDRLYESSPLYQQAQSSILSQAHYYLEVTENSPYDISIDTFYWGSNMSVANAGVILGLAYRLTLEESYLTAAEANLHYLLGRNAVNTCFVTGYGSKSPLHPHHRVSMLVKQPVKGMLAGGVNSFLNDTIATKMLVQAAPEQCYIDHSESYSTNEVTIYWNSSMIYLLSLLENHYSTNILKGE